MTSSTSIFRLAAAFLLIAILMTTYVAFMGHSASRASAIAIHDVSTDLVNSWHTISSTLEIPLNRTKPGMLSPVIPERYSALDLVIYGHEIVTPEFKADYKNLTLPRMFDQLHISITDQGLLKYNVGGTQLISLDSRDGTQGAAYFMDVPASVIESASKLYDNQPMKGDRDGQGVVRYDRLEDGRYVMGMYVTYAQPAG